MATATGMFRRSEHDREIVKLAVPALGQLGAEPLYVIVDTAVVGHLGTQQLGGLAIAGTLLTTAFWLFNFLSYGTTATVARLHGAGDERTATHRAVQAMWLAGFIGVALAIVGGLTAEWGVSLMGASADVRPEALTYLRVSLFGVPALLLTLAGMGFFRGLQNTATPLWIALYSNIANLVIEVVLIYGFHWGIEGSALATVIAQWGAAAWYLRYVAREVARQQVSIRPEMVHLKDLAMVGRDLLTRTGALLLALGLATSVAARLGDVALGAHQIAYQVWIFLALALDALAIAGQALIGARLGRGDGPGARAVSVRLIELGVWVGIVFGVAVLVVRPFLGDVFTDDPAVDALLGTVLVIVAVFQPVNAVVFVLDGILIGAGDFRYLAVAMIAAAAVFTPIALAVLTLDLALWWLWAALGMLMTARLVANLTRFDSEAWMVTGAVRKH